MAAGDVRTAVVLLAALGERERTTSQLYDDVGYMPLVQAGLVPYHGFRAALDGLAREGLVTARSDEDGATLWQRTEAGARLAGRYSAA